MDKEYGDDYYPQGDEVDIMPDESYEPEPTNPNGPEPFEYYDIDAGKYKTAYPCPGCNKVWKYRVDLKRCIESNHTYNNICREI